MKRRYIAIMTVVLSLLGLIVAGCGEKPEEPVLAGEEVGEYYCDADGKEYTLSLTSACEYTLVMGETELSGKYVPSGETVTLSVAEGTLTATYYGDVVRLEYAGQEYRFLRKIDYTVTFDTNGGGSISEQSVRNGRTAQKPEDPKKTGEVFVGWYTDSTFKSTYSFKEPVTSNLKLYARFVQPIDPEFTVSFDVNGGSGSFDDVETVGHKLFSLPTPEWEGHTFVGWWVSGYGEKSKLTYQYKEQLLEENTTLYAVWAGEAPAVSVEEDKIVWTSAGTNVQYRLVVKNQTTNQEETFTLNETEREYRFADKEAGDYEITVTVNGKTGTAYYRNKGLSKVTVFKVENNTLLFNGVDHATSYLLTVECGTVGHHSRAIELGAADEDRKYDFSQCEMKDGAITFTVTAQAEGYLSSTSEPYKVTRTLAQATGMQVDKTTETLTWTAVDNATSYDVVITQGSSNLLTTSTEQTTLALKSYNAGTLKITITPKARGWNSPAPADYSYDKLTLATPQNVHVSGSSILWERVQGATSYVVSFGGEKHTVTGCEFELTEDLYKEGVSSYAVTVEAKSENNASVPSDVFQVRYGELGGELRYRDGVLSWDPVFGVHKFSVTIGENEAVIYEDTNSVSVSFTGKGEYLLSVCAVYDDGTDSAPITTTVTVYELSFDSTGDSIVENQYYVKGDTLKLPDVKQTGYTFEGWYTALTDGQLFEDKVYNDDNDRKLYGRWDPLSFTIRFVVGSYGTLSEEYAQGVTVKYRQPADLPVPEITDPVYGFIGWYSDATSQEQRHTDYTGHLNSFSQLSDQTYYAQYVAVLEFTKKSSGSTEEYQVSKAADIAKASPKHIVIPEKYQNIRVTEVIDFTGCDFLEEIDIPDSIRLISVASTESAFTGCKNLKKINIYETDYSDTKLYSDEDGVLLYQNNYTNKKELKLYPVGRNEETYTVPDGVQSLLSGNFNNLKALQELIIPASVTLIEKGAVSYSSASTSSTTNNLAKVTFLAAADGVEEVPLEIRNGAFSKCAKLVDLTLPARMSNFNFNDMFEQCLAVQNINIVGTGGNYKSIEGVLVNDLGSGGYELVYYPIGRTEFNTPAGVTAIGTRALKGNNVLTSITISHQITEIKAEAFSTCTKVTSITFEGTAEDFPLTIGESAFYKCTHTSLKSIVLPENLVKVGKNAFGDTKIATVTLNSKVGDGQTLEFEEQAFGSSPVVTTLIIGPYVKDVNFTAVFGSKLQNIQVDPQNTNYENNNEEGVLYSKGIKSVVWYSSEKVGSYTLPETVEEISADNFRDKTNLTGIVLHNKLKKIGINAFSGTGLQSVTFLSGGEADLVIEDSAFAKCKDLTSVEFPERLKTLGQRMFEGCTKIQSVHFPASLTSITTYSTDSSSTVLDTSLGMFSDNCTSLVTLTVAAGNHNYAAIDNVLYKKGTEGANGTDEYISELMYCPISKAGTVTIPATVERIWRRAFYASNANASKVTEVKFEKDTLTPKVTEGGSTVARSLVISTDAFCNCGNLQSVQLPNGTRSFNYRAFEDCDALVTINIPNTVSSLAGQTFYNCDSLANVTFDKGNTENPLVLERSTQPGTSTTYSGVFNGCYSLRTIELPERTTRIGTGAFTGTRLESITIPANVSEIEERGFSGIGYYDYTQSTGYYTPFVYTLKKVEFVMENSKLRVIGESAFAYAPIEKIVLPKSLEVLSDSAFYYCEQLVSVDFGDNSNLQQLGSDGNSEGVFINCKSLREVKFGANSQLKYIYKNAFTGCTALQSIVIPASVEEIGDRAFYQTNKTGEVGALSSVTFEGNGQNSHLRYLGTAFYHSGITEFRFPKSVNDIELGTSIFEYSNNLESLYISTSVKDLNGIFNNCPVKNVEVAPGHPTYYVDDTLPILYYLVDNSIVRVFGDISGSVTISDRAQVISDGAFAGNTGLTEIHIPQSVTRIGKTAFQKCTGLLKVEIAGSSALSLIDEKAFQGCSSLQTVTFGPSAGVELRIGLSAFADCKALTSVDFGANSGLISLGTSRDSNGNYTSSNAFQNCNNLQRVTFGVNSKLQAIGQSAFAQCINLSEVDFENLTNLTQLRSYAFQNCAFERMDLSKTKITDLASSAILFNKAEDCKLTEILLPSTLTGKLNMTFQYFKVSSIDLSHTSITELKSSVFSDCVNLTSVIFPSSDEFTYLPENAFKNCTSLQEIDLSYTKLINLGGTTNKLTQVTTKSSVFYGCKNLKKVILPETLSNIGVETFRDCTALTDINLEVLHPNADGYCIIGNNAFQNCGLTKVTLPLNVVTWPTSSGKGAFNGCTQLTEVVFPAGMTAGTVGENGKVTGDTKLGSYLFENCTSLTTLTFEQGCGLTTLPVGMLSGCTGYTTLKLPAHITSLGNNVFQNCTGLETITIPATVTTFGSSVFSGCTKLATADLSASNATKLGSSMFNGCTALTTVKLPHALEEVSSSAFKGLAQLTEVELPATVTTIASSAFEGTGLTKVTVPASLTGTLGSSAYAKCLNLQEVDLSASALTKIDSSFSSCTALTTVKLPASVTEFGTSAFNGCSQLTDINLENVKVLGIYSLTGTGLKSFHFKNGVTYARFLLKDCKDLSNITFEDGFNEALGDTSYGSVFENDTALTEISFGNNFGGTFYKTSFKGCTNLHTVHFGNNFHGTLGANMFENCTNLKTLDFGQNFQGIFGGAYIFGNCQALAEVNIPDTAVIGSTATYLFQKCTSLTSVHLPDSMEILPANIFNGCSSLAELTFPTSLTFIGAGAFTGTALKVADLSKTQLTELKHDVAKDFNLSGSAKTFQNCKELTTVILPDSLTKIGGYVFDGCASLSSINLGKVTQIGTAAFQNCVALTDEALDLSAVEVLSGIVFKGCTGLKNISMPSLNTLGYGTFTNCTELVTFSAPNVTSMGDTSGQHFQGCVALATVTLGDIDTLPKTAFQNCSSLTEVHLGSKLATIANLAFQNCTALKSVNLPALITLGDQVFEGSGLETFNAPQLQSIGMSAFKDTASLGALNLPCLTTLGQNAFENSGITYFTAPLLPTVSNFAFLNTKRLEGVDVSAATYIGQSAFEGSAIKSISARSVEELQISAFYNAENLQEISLPALTTVGNTAASAEAKGIFEGSGLTSFTVPVGLTAIPPYLFNGAAHLASISVAIGNNNFYVDEASGALIAADGTLVAYPEGKVYEENTLVLNGVTGVQQYVFAKGTNVKKVQFEEGLLSISSYAFSFSVGVEEVLLPNTLTTIEAYAFRNSSIKRIVIPESVTVIGNCAFQASALESVEFLCGDFSTGLTGSVTPNQLFRDCTALTSVTLSQTMTKLGANWFAGCTALKEIVIPSSVTSIADNTFADWTAEQKICFTDSEEDVKARLGGDSWKGNATVEYNYGSAQGPAEPEEPAEPLE